MANETEELSVEEVRNSLSKFQRDFAQLRDIEEPPQTLLHVLRRESKETYWNKILSYFLDPTEPHGFGTDLLEAFLSLLESRSKLDPEFDGVDSGEIEVKSEWVMRDLEVRPDITVYSERQWFIVIEMKVGASEGKDQTHQYAESDYIGDIRKNEFGEGEEGRDEGPERSEPNEGHNYVYLAPEKAPNANAGQFANIAWRDVLRTLAQFERRSYGRYPAKSQAQLNDFLDTIRRELDMTDEKIEQNQIDKMELYFEYADAFDEAEDALDKVQERERRRWQERFLNGFKPSNWDEEKWRCRGDFAHIYKEGWQVTKDQKPIEDGSAPFRISFTHDISSNPFEKGTVEFRIYCPKGADDEFRSKFSRKFHGNDEIRKFFQEKNINHATKNKTKLTKKEYAFDQKELPGSYYETLKTAFEEHQKIADRITRIFEKAVDEVVDGN